MPQKLFAADVWTQVSYGGFGTGAATQQADRGVVFNDPVDGNTYAYLGTKNTVFGGGVWRSSDGVIWSQINNNGFGSSAVQAVVGIYSFTAGGVSGVYAGAAAPSVGGRIYRSLGGAQSSSWQLVFSSMTTGNTQNILAGGHAAVLGSVYYIGTKNPTNGGEIWKSTSADSTSAWIQVSTGGFGGGTNNENISYFKGFGGNLYAATNCSAVPCGQIWKSTGTVNPADKDTWTQVLVASVTFDAALNTQSVSVLESFGGYLYAGTLKQTGGAQLWRTTTPDVPGSWAQVNSPDGASGSRFALATSTEVHSLRALNGVLYAGTWDTSGGAVVYRSTDGITWQRSNATAGFTGANNQYPGDFLLLGTLPGGYVYAGTLNTVEGSIVWRASLPQPIPANLSSIQTSSIAASYGGVGNMSTGFVVDASTSSDFSTTLLSSVTASLSQLSLAPQGLLPNTTYYLRAGALWGNATGYINTTPANTYTLAAQPSSLSFTVAPPTANSIQLNWSAGLNGPGVSFSMLTSTAANPSVPAGAVVTTSVTFNTFVSSVGLVSDTTYYFQVASINNNSVQTAYVNASTLTLPFPTGTLVSTYTSVQISSIALAWTPGLNLLPPNGPTLTYTAQISTAALPNGLSGNVSTTVPTANAVFGTSGAGTPLNGNTTYYFQVQALNASGGGLFTTYGSTATLAAPPTASAYSPVGVGSITANWASNTNSIGTTYYLLLSTGSSPSTNGFFGNVSTTTANLSVTFGCGGAGPSLTPAAAYYIQARALNYDGIYSTFTDLGSTTTLAVAVPSPAAFSGLTISTIQANWFSNCNPGSTAYNAVLSTGPSPSTNGFSGNVVSNNYNLFAVFSPLAYNTTYYVDVKAISGGGVNSTYVSLGSTSTLAAVPSTAPLSGLTTTTIQANWGANGNPPWTPYMAILSTGPSPGTNGISGNISSTTLNVFALFSGLRPNTTYFADVRALSNAGGPTAAPQLFSTSTLAAAPTSFIFTPPSTSAIQLSWGSMGNGPGVIYTVLASTAPDPVSPAGAVVTTSVTFNTSVSTAGLVANTTYFFRIAATNNNGVATGYAAAVATPTLAAVVSSAAFSGVTQSTIQANWLANGNPPWTLYSAVLSTGASPSANGFSGNITSTTYNAFAAFGGLSPNTTYFADVTAINSAGAATTATILPSTSSLAAQPANFTFNTSTANVIQLNWSSAGNGPGASYTVLTSTAPDPSSPAGAVVTTSVTFNTFISTAGLAANVTYYFRLAATNNNGLTTPFTAAVSTATLPPAPPVNIEVPVDSPGFGTGSATPQADRGVVFLDPSDGNNYIYFGSKNTTFGGGVWRSSDGVSWNQINNNGFGSSSNQAVVGVYAFNNGIAGAAFACTSNGAGGGQVYRSLGGAQSASWKLVFSSATTGGAQDSSAGASAAVLGGVFYIGTKNTAGGGEIWKSTSADSTGAWIQVSTGGFGGGAANGNVAYMTAFGGSLYAAAGCGAAPCGQIWKSTGTVNPTDNDVWTQVLVASVTFDPGLNTSAISAMESFQGFFYAATARASGGAQLWRTATPDVPASWAQVFSPDGDGATRFSLSTTQEVHSLRAFNGLLYSGTWDATAGLNVYVSTNGVLWKHIDSPAGFGDVNNQYVGDFAFMSAGGRGWVFADTLNSVSGAGVWRASLVAPDPASAASIQISSVSVAYTLRGTTVNGYEVDASTAADFSGAVFSSVTASVVLGALAPQGLSPNTTYFLRAGAIWGNTTGYFYLNPASTTTLAAQPTGLTFAVAPPTAGTIQLNWSSAGNGPGATYAVLASTAANPGSPAGAAVFSSVGAAASSNIGGLAADTTYFFQVRAVNNNGIAGAYTIPLSTFTLPLPPGVAGATFTAVQIGSITINWTPGLNPSSGAPLTYIAQMSTGAFPNSLPGNVSTRTASLSVTFGAGGILPALSPGTSYYFQVQAVNVSGGGQFASLGSTSTLALAPAALAYSPVAINSIQANWTSSGNSTGTIYSAVLSTGSSPSTNGFGGNVTTTTIGLSMTFGAGGAGPLLTSGATYFVQVKAVNYDGISSTYTDLGSTATLLVAVPAILPFSGITISTIQANWGANGNPGGTAYYAVLSTGPSPSTNGFAGNVISNNYNLFAVYSPLAYNTTYYADVKAINPSGTPSAFAGLGAASTLAASPSTAAVSAVSSGSLQANWGFNGNPAWTYYKAVLSTGPFPAANGFSGNFTSSATFNASASFPGLAANTTYYGDVRAFNNAAVPSTATVLFATSTLAAVPTGASSVALSSVALQWSWSAAGNGPGVGYNVLTSTAADPAAPAGAVVTASVTFNTFFSTAGLTANTTYFWRVAAVNNNGVPTVSTGPVAAMTFADLPGPGSPLFPVVQASSVSLNWTRGANPPNTPLTFIAEASLDPNFGVSMSSFTPGLNATWQGLSPNTTYYFEVLSVNAAGVINFPSAGLGSTSTLAAQPTSLVFNTVAPTTYSIQMNWSAAGNGPGTAYTVLTSTAPNPAAPTGAAVTSSTTFNTSLSTAGLTAGTTYFFQVLAINNNGVPSAYTAPASTFTLPVAPGAALPAFTSVQASSITVNWTAGGNYSTGPAVSYNAVVSTGAFPNAFAGNVTASTTGLSMTFGISGAGPALNRNTTYFFQVQAVNGGGPGAFVFLGSTSTLAATPAGLVFNVVAPTTNSIQLNWSAAGNGPGASYTVQTSTAPNFAAPAGAVVATSVTFNTSLSTAGLAADTTYFFQVLATNNNGIPSAYSATVSTFTLPLAPAAGALAIANVQGASVTVNWLAGPNYSTGPALTYNAMASTGAFPNAFAGNVTANTAFLNVTFGTGGSGPPLSPNTSYFFQVQAVNGSGPGAFISLGSTSTLAATPMGMVFNVVAPTTNSIQLNWSASGNGPGASYTVQTSTTPNFAAPAGAVVTTSVTFNTSLSTAGLAADTTYFFQVLATNNNGIPSAYSATISTFTLPLAPAAAGAAITNVQASSVTVNWTAGVNYSTGPALSYNAAVSTGAFPNAFAGNVTANTFGLSMTFGTGGAGPALSPNTTYFFQVQAVNGGGPGAFVSLGSTSTLAAQPTGLVFNVVVPATNSIQLNWSSAGNGPGVSYTVLTSTASNPFSPAGAVVTTSVTFNTSLSTAGLNADATYYFQVLATNNSGIPSAYTAAISTFTLPLAPGGPAIANVQGSSVTVSWTAAPNPASGPALTYSAVASTGAFPNTFTGNLTANTASSNITFGTGGAGPALSPNTTYFFQVQAVNGSGAGAFLFLGSTSTLALLPGAPGFGVSATVGSIQFTWSPNGNGSGVSYTVLTSTASNPVSPAGAVVTTSVTFNTSLSTAGLTADTTYYFQVAAMNNSGVFSAYTALVSTFTLPLAPGGPAIANVQGSSVTISWTVAPNPASSPPLTYNAVASTGAFPNTFAGNVTVNTASPNITFGTGGAGPALSPNTTYFFQVQAVNGSGAGAFLFLGSTSTLGLSPGASGFGGPATVNSIQFTWSPSGNGPGVSYTVLTSTASNPSSPAGAVVTTSVTFNTSLSTAGLNADSTYYFQVLATNNNGVPSAYSAVVSTFTLPLAPGGATIANVQGSSVTVSWTAAPNPASGPALTYSAVASTGAFPNAFGGNVAVNTASSNITFGTGGAGPALSPNTTYFFQVQAVNGSGAGAFLFLGSTSTLALLPGAPGFGASATVNSIQFAWSPNGNGAGVSYAVLTSTASNPVSPVGAVVTTSVTFNTSLSTAGLTADTTYYFQVAAMNNSGVFSAYTAPVSTVTLPLAPGAGAPAFIGIGASSITVSWSSGNPAGGAPLTYSAVLSTGAFPNAFAGNVTAGAAGLSATFGMGGAGPALVSNTTYFFQVQAVNGSGAGSFAAVGATMTAAGAPTGLSFGAPTAGALQLNWSFGGNNSGVSYQMLVSTAPNPIAPAGAAVTSSVTYNAYASTSGLVANTTYFFQVQAISASGSPSAYAAAVATSTLANVPTGLGFGAPTASSLLLAWSSAGNGPTPAYSILVSTAPNPSAPAGAAVTAALSFAASVSSAGLRSNTTYYFQVAAINNNNIPTAYAAAVASATLAALPVSAPPTNIQNSTITANWGAGGNPPQTAYMAQASTDPAFGVVNAASSTFNLFADLTGLARGTTYYLRVQAINLNAVPTAFTALPAALTLTAAPSSPTLSSAALGVSSIAWSWSAVANVNGYRLASQAGANVSGDLAASTTQFTEAGLSSNTAYTRQAAAFNAFGASTSAALTRYTLAAAPAALSFGQVYVTSITVSWLANGNPAGTTYYAMIWQTGGATTTIPVSLTGATFTGLNGASTFFMTVQAVNGDGLIASSGLQLSTATLPLQSAVVAINPNTGGTAVFNAPAGQVTVSVPPQAFSIPVVVTVSTMLPPVAPAVNGLTPSGVAISISLDQPVQPSRGVPVSVGFRDSDVAGLDKGTLALARYDPARNVWVPLFSTVDPIAHTVTGVTDHFSIFQIMAIAPAGGLSNAKVFPNPFRPALGHTLMTFSNLPAGASLSVYTMLGELVNTLTANASGLASWDGTTQAGWKAASGVYVVFIRAGSTKNIKVAIQR